MGKSDDRYDRLVRNHRTAELQAWHLFGFELERQWDLLYPGFRESEYFNAIESMVPNVSQVGARSAKFVKQHFNPEKRGWFQENTIAESNGLIVRARQRLRSRYHCSLTVAPSPGFVASPSVPSMLSWELYLTPKSLVAGMRFASALDYAVTLSTPRSGASERGFHFLAMPRLLRFGGRSSPLYNGLENGSAINLRSSAHCTIDLIVYPAFCVHVHGIHRDVASVVWRLAHDYNSLVSFNLVVIAPPGQAGLPETSDEPKGPTAKRAHVEHSSVYFFPRPWRPDWEGPKAREGQDWSATRAFEDWSFGAFEMGGFFVQGDKNIYEAVTHEDLCDFLSEVSIFRYPDELDRITSVLVDLAPAPDTKAKIDSYIHQSG
ncbi:MAG: hypothetical protein ACREA2_08765 [Blastocatellia bacterium]